MKLKKDVFLPLPPIEVEAAVKTIATTFEALGRLMTERTRIATEIKDQRDLNDTAQGVTINKGRDYRVQFTLVRSINEGMKEFLFPLEAIEIRKLATDAGRMDTGGFLLDGDTGLRTREELSSKEDRNLPDLEVGPIVEKHGTMDIPPPTQPVAVAKPVEKVMTKSSEAIDFSGLVWDKLLNTVIETLEANDQEVFKSDEKAPDIAASIVFLYQSFGIKNNLEDPNRKALDSWLTEKHKDPLAKRMERLKWKATVGGFHEVIDYIAAWKPVFPAPTTFPKIVVNKEALPHIQYLETMYNIAQDGSYNQKLIEYWNGELDGTSIEIPSPQDIPGHKFPKMTWATAKACLDKWKVEVYDNPTGKPPGPPKGGLPAGVVEIKTKIKEVKK